MIKSETRISGILAVAAANAFAYSPHPDGKRFLVNVEEGANPTFNLITNWRKLLPSSR